MNGEARYRLATSVKMVDPFGGQGRIFGRKDMHIDSTVKLSPGGRYLFALHTDSNENDQREELQVYDLDKGGICVWSLPIRGFINTYDIEVLQDGRLRVAMECVCWIDVKA